MRWTYLRKARVIKQVSSGNISRAEAIARHDLSEDELTEWERRFAAGGAEALMIRELAKDRAKTAQQLADTAKLGRMT